MLRAGRTAFIGSFIAVAMSAITGPFLQTDMVFSNEVMTRTTVGLDGVALAFASGIAAVLSLTTGLSMTLVGVMVAVALLPPASVLGLMIGSGQWGHAAGALELLIVNIVCVNFSGQLVFLFKGFKPRTWFERKLAKPYVWGGLIFWGLAFVIMTVFAQTEFF